MCWSMRTGFERIFLILSARMSCSYRPCLFTRLSGPHSTTKAGRPGSMANLRYVDWERGTENSPYTFQEADREMLLGLPHLFARKFDRDIFKDRPFSNSQPGN